jgi:hypothetical protein
VDKCVARGNDKRVTRVGLGARNRGWGCRGALRSGLAPGARLRLAWRGGLIGRSREAPLDDARHDPLPARPHGPPRNRAAILSAALRVSYAPVALTVPGRQVPDDRCPPQRPAASPGAAAIKPRRAEETVRSSLGTSTRNRVSGCTGSTAVRGRAGRGSDRASSSGAEPVEPSRARRLAKRRRAARAEAPDLSAPHPSAPRSRAPALPLRRPLDLHRDDRIDVREQMHAHLVRPDRTDGLAEMDVVAVDPHACLTLDSLGDVGGRH